MLLSGTGSQLKHYTVVPFWYQFNINKVSGLFVFNYLFVKKVVFTPVTTNLGCAPLTHIQLVEVTHSHFKRTKGFFRDLNGITRFNAANTARAWTQSVLTIIFVPQGWKILQHSLYIILRQYIWTSTGLWNGTLGTIVDIVTDVMGLSGIWMTFQIAFW